VDADQLRSLANAIAQKEKDLRAAKSELNKAATALYGKIDKDGSIKTRGSIHKKRESLSEDEAKSLILRKLHDLMANETEQFLKNQQRMIIRFLEKLWEKYSSPLNVIESQRDMHLDILKSHLSSLGYDKL
jgi:type I restriction enzyme M protein